MLAPLAGKTLLQLTYENAKRAPVFQQLVIATDDVRIQDHARSFGGPVVMTSMHHVNGSDRAAEVLANHAEYQHYEIVIVVQGDEPCVDPSLFRQLADKLIADPEAVVATAMAPIQVAEDVDNPGVVKCVTDRFGRALYFSRSRIPFNRHQPVVYHKHIGIYAFRRDFLKIYGALPPTPLQLTEDLEQLKVLEHGYRIAVATVEAASDPGVNTPEDLRRVEARLATSAARRQ